MTGIRAWLALFYVPITDLYIVEYREDMTPDLGERTFDDAVSKGMAHALPLA